MANKDLIIGVLQADILWEQPEANRARFAEIIHAERKESQVIFLPEMFTTGFTMQPATCAEGMNGATVQWMKQLSRQMTCIIAGSVAVRDGDNYYNRFLWVLPNGVVQYYDKRHLFSYAGEQEVYTRGDKRVIVQVNGWKICLQVCYDLRFPVWSRNTDDYDALVYVANWPQQRNVMWEALLQARAIENLSYAIGVNRVGEDGNGHQYIGNSSVYDPLGATIMRHEHSQGLWEIKLDAQSLNATRERFRFLEDKDRFILI